MIIFLWWGGGGARRGGLERDKDKNDVGYEGFVDDDGNEVENEEEEGHVRKEEEDAKQDGALNNVTTTISTPTFAIIWYSPWCRLCMMFVLQRIITHHVRKHRLKMNPPNGHPNYKNDINNNDDDSEHRHQLQ